MFCENDFALEFGCIAEGADKMAIELPYLPSYKNVERLFSSIATAKAPDVFTHTFLTNTIGLKGTADRQFISLLRTLGFLDGANKPTAEYAHLKNPSLSKKAIAAALRRAYQPLFDANENANTLSNDDLKGLIAQTAGSDAGMTQKISGTFNAISKLADWSGGANPIPRKERRNDEAENEDETPSSKNQNLNNNQGFGFHYNIQVHLPNNASEETYLNIFNAIRKVFA